MNWSGKRIRTKIEDYNEVERGVVTITVGWPATVGECVDQQGEAEMYVVAWDNNADGEDMGWCYWTNRELEMYAEGY